MIRKQPIIVGGMLVIALFILSATSGSAADIEWTTSGQLDLKAPALDVCPSADGKWLYLLSAGEIAVYSFAEGKIINRIPLDAAFDRLVYVKETNSLVATSRSNNKVQIIRLDVVYKFTTTGLPYKGAKNAPVTIAVFSDYQ
jgi:protein-disulfide isomerase